MTEQDEQFETWRERHGQYLRAGGGQYELTFAYEAWNARGDQDAARIAELDAEATRNAAMNDQQAKRIAELEAELATIKQPIEARCKSCGGNDGDMPCAYPGEKKHGCLRNARLAIKQQEPVAWRYKDSRGHWRYVGNGPTLVDYPHQIKEALYTSPQPAIPEGWNDDLTLLESILRGYPPSLARNDGLSTIRKLLAAAPQPTGEKK